METNIVWRPGGGRVAEESRGEINGKIYNTLMPVHVMLNMKLQLGES